MIKFVQSFIVFHDALWIWSVTFCFS